MNSTEKLIKGMALVIWLVSGIGYMLPGTTLLVAWGYGLFFGLTFVSMSTWVVGTALRFVCSRSPKFKSLLDKRWGLEE